MQLSQIRNFCIIAHIDHGKSTLADRLLEKTNTIPQRHMLDQVLDNMDLERERGITIKAHAVRMNYTAKDGQEYILNLIDTPGHVDFTYEVSRSLAACEGALLLVDASQGVEAQTISNLYLALENNLTIIPVINKIDLPGAQIEQTKRQLQEILGAEEQQILLASAKEGLGIDQILETIVDRIPPPAGEKNASLLAMIFDSYFDQYRGAVALVRIKQGKLSKGDRIKFFSSGKEFETDEVGYLRLKLVPAERLTTGEVGYLMANLKNVSDTKVGDTIASATDPAPQALPGFKNIKPMVFSGLYPTEADNYQELREAMEKLKLNDSSLVFEPESSNALGFGFRCGFLGLLHMEIVQERLHREYGLSLIATVPNVEYKVIQTEGKKALWVENPALLPSPDRIQRIEEPFVLANLITPSDFIGSIMKLCQERRGVYRTTEYVDRSRASLKYELPLSEIIFDFYDKLKSTSKGYASLDYDFLDYRESDLVKLDVLINGDPVDALSTIVHRQKAYQWGKNLCSKLRELIPRQLFQVAIQAAVGNRVIARENVAALRKNVTAKCYGGDITRKRKLWEKQKEGKKRMKQIGAVEIPQEAFLAILKLER
ncbi:MAG: elongation factor 4 [candidate division Zixibacteria bacterium RBG_16_48_11]|nr:MAG: elongation factor 4 [candidate division Zixibacteria bacterium RBG_16_48_11]